MSIHPVVGTVDNTAVMGYVGSVAANVCVFFPLN